MIEKLSPTLINPDSYYNSREAIQFTQVNSREILTLHIRNGFLRAMVKGEGKGKKYRIKGAWLLKYIKEYKNKHSKFSRLTGFRLARKNKAYEKFKNRPRGKR